MKVSKKVGRRKCASSIFVSRRRLRNKNKKSSYKKKHTQRGGKRGRGYKRMRAHTHKRGKRFHRGGAECEDGGIKDTEKPGLEIDLKDYTLKSNVHQTNALQINDSHVTHYPHGYVKCFSHNTKSDKVDVYAIGFTNVPLAYTKEGLLTGSRVPGKFKVVITERKPNSRDVVHKTNVPLRQFQVILTRQDNYTGKFSRFDPGMALETYFILHKSSLSDILLALTEANPLERIQSNHKGDYYSFSYPENQKFFELLIEAAKVLAIYVEGLFTAEKDATDILLAEQEQDYNTRMRQAEVIENQLRANLREKNDEAIAQVRELGDNLELTLCGQNAPIKFSDFKRELIELAQSNKQKIDHDKTLAFTKERSKIEIDKIVKVIVNAQYKLMKNSFIHLKVYGN
ncbi:MAG: hypothetical protein WCO72_15930, partial [Betaproteobacteria bacterium]